MHGTATPGILQQCQASFPVLLTKEVQTEQYWYGGMLYRCRWRGSTRERALRSSTAWAEVPDHPVPTRGYIKAAGSAYSLKMSLCKAAGTSCTRNGKQSSDRVNGMPLCPLWAYIYYRDFPLWLCRTYGLITIFSEPVSVFFFSSPPSPFTSLLISPIREVPRLTGCNVNTGADMGGHRNTFSLQSTWRRPATDDFQEEQLTLL